MEKRRRQGNYPPQKDNSIEDLAGKEENEYPGPDPNEIMINVTNEKSDAKSRKRSLRKPGRNYKTQLTTKYKRH
jgi:hypothetical protein